MTENEAAELKKGDRVKIIDHVGCGWATDGSMDKWCGKVMTIEKVGHFFRMKEDPEHVYTADDFVSKVSSNRKTFAIAVRVKSGATTVYLPDGKQATVVCDKEDEYDEYTGIKLALAKAYGVIEKEEEKQSPDTTSQKKHFSGEALCINNISKFGGKIVDCYDFGKVYHFVNGVEIEHGYHLDHIEENNPQRVYISIFGREDEQIVFCPIVREG